MPYLIQTPGGEQMIVDSLDGHSDCIVINANAPAMTLADAKEMKLGQVDLLLYMQFQGGFSPISGPLLGHTLQTRDNSDRTNWLTSQASYRTQIDKGNGAVAQAHFRTADNQTITCTFQEGFDALMAMAQWGAGLMGKSWTLKDAINALTDPAAVLAYDVAAQWALLP